MFRQLEDSRDSSLEERLRLLTVSSNKHGSKCPAEPGTAE